LEILIHLREVEIFLTNFVLKSFENFAKLLEEKQDNEIMIHQSKLKMSQRRNLHRIEQQQNFLFYSEKQGTKRGQNFNLRNIQGWQL
jgi:hypothetical protein